VRLAIGGVIGRMAYANRRASTVSSPV